MSATYYASAKRFCRQYRASNLTATYASLTSAVEAAARLQVTPWKFIPAYRSPSYPAHAETAENPADRDYFDAYEMCAEHADTMHRAYAGCAAYRIELPDAFIGATLESLAVAVSSDPYNPFGARVAIATSAAGANQPAEDWDTIREGSAHADGQAPRTVSTDGTLWYGATATVTLTPAGGLVLGKYVWVYLTLENYERARNGWLEGASKINPVFTLITSAAVAGFSDGVHVGGGYETPTITLSVADVASAPQKFGTTVSTWPAVAFRYQEIFGGYRKLALSSYATPASLATASRELLVTIPGALAASVAELVMHQAAHQATDSSFAYTQWGLAANLKRLDSTDDYIFATLSHYMLPFVPQAGLSPSVMRLTNGSTAQDLHSAVIQITPYLIASPSDPTTKTKGYWWWAMRAIANQAAFWLGNAATVAGTINTGDTTPIPYSLTAIRLGPPAVMPDTLAASASMYVDLSIEPTDAGMIVLVPWIVDQGAELSASPSQVGLGTLLIDNYGSVAGAGWRPAVALL